MITLDKEVNVKKRKKTVTRGHGSLIRGNPPIHGADLCLDLAYGQNEIRSIRKIKIRMFSVRKEQLVTKRSIV